MKFERKQDFFRDNRRAIGIPDLLKRRARPKEDSAAREDRRNAGRNVAAANKSANANRYSARSAELLVESNAASRLSLTYRGNDDFLVRETRGVLSPKCLLPFLTYSFTLSLRLCAPSLSLSLPIPPSPGKDRKTSRFSTVYSITREFPTVRATRCDFFLVAVAVQTLAIIAAQMSSER